MKMSESIKQIAPALHQAQLVMGGAKKGANNPFFKSKYADLGAVLEACKEELNVNGITILQPHFTNERGTFVETILLHTSGEFVSSETRVVYGKENDPQAQGSAITYARRYGLQSLVSMPAEDDDGEKAVSRVPNKSQEKSSGAERPPALLSKPVESYIASVTNNTPLVDKTLVNVNNPPAEITDIKAARSSFRRPAVTEVKKESENGWE